ncbi:MAG: glycosyl hydrolase 53 family protein [Oscillospiraceae bacterium]|nr:glycosyl hydrolase 53 family protein [Oscillospiraceae bacterium]
MILGVDVSTYLEELAHGAVFKDGGKVIDPLDAFVANGVNWMRIRVWNEPKSEKGEEYLAGSCDMDNYIRLGRLAKEKGYKILMDFHYSDFWADPGKQMIPKAWLGYHIDAMEKAVYEFTAQCLERAIAEDVAPEMVQIGNEITNGILWPLGKLENADGTRGNYENFTRLIKAGVKATREALPNAKIALHLERSNDKAVYQEFFTEMKDREVDYDIIGSSYYPYWHGTPDELFDNLRACRRFGKEIMILELGYGFTMEAYNLAGENQRLVIDAERAFVPGLIENYPFTPQGQKEYISYILGRCKEENISGVFYWEPLWIPGEGICWASEAGQAYIHEEGKSTTNEWANQCLFDYEGEKLPAFDAFQKLA